jgi:hypothetical protein
VALGEGQNRVAVAVLAGGILMGRRPGAAPLGHHGHIRFEIAAGADHHHAGGGVGAAAVSGMNHHLDGLGREFLILRPGQIRCQQHASSHGKQQSAASKARPYVHGFLPDFCST